MEAKTNKIPLLKKIDFKQKKYIMPLIAFPFLIWAVYNVGDFLSQNEVEPEKQEINTSLGDTDAEILSKNDSYDMFFENKDTRTMLDEFGEDDEKRLLYAENLTEKQKRYIDSLEYVRSQKLNTDAEDFYNQKMFDYETASRQQRERERELKAQDDRDYERSMELIRMLNREASGNYGGNSNSSPSASENYYAQEEKPEDPVSTLRRQMIMLDSLEKSKDPEYIAMIQAEERMKKNKERMEAFLNSTLKVEKASLNSQFNTISKVKENNFIRAVIDENVKGYSGSRIRFRLLEDIFVGKNHRIPKGTILYGQISGFNMQRVKLNIVSVLHNGEILPINLTIYDNDGMEGLYVPASAFREMVNEFGSNSMQGQNMNNSGDGFFTSMWTKLFQSTSTTIANLIRKNKVKLKYNSYVYLINEQELQQRNNQ